ncbi:MAG: glycosyltransferase family 52 [Pseudomonadota bacterium]
MSKPRSLYLCRTPFQLLLCQEIVAQYPEEEAELLYITDINGPKDHAYFEAARTLFTKSHYRVRQSNTDILAFVLGPGRRMARRYDAIALGNHTLSHFRYVITRNPGAEIRSFDEGCGNFNVTGALHNDPRNRTERLRDQVLRIPPIAEVFARSAAHFTVNATLRNVVPSERLRQIDLIKLAPGRGGDRAPINLVIGHPFEEHVDTEHRTLMLGALRALSSGHYVMHPREKPRDEPLAALDLIQDDPRILEHYVRDLVAAGHRVRLIGSLSTVFFTVNSPAVEKYYLHLMPEDGFLGLARQVGCMVFDLHDPVGLKHWHETAAAWADADRGDARAAAL